MSQVEKTQFQSDVFSNDLGCQGCSAALAVRYILKALGEKTVVVLPAYCWAAITGSAAPTAVKVPFFHKLDSHTEREATVLAWADKGKVFDISIKVLLDAAKRNESLLYVCYDNESYLETKGSLFALSQSFSGSRMPEHSAAKSPQDILMLLLAQQIPYLATATIAYPEDLVKKVQKAKQIKGTRFIHVLAPCSPGWRVPPELAMTLARLAVKTCLFPLYEVEQGKRYTISLAPESLPVHEYLQLQERYAHLSESEIQQIQLAVDTQWQALQARAARDV
jgi:pyruvate/2-oxoacid:ferredoxin oxidoreductase beta subunit